MTIDVERDLRAAMRAVTAEVTARPDTVGLVRERFRRRRRNRRAAVAVAVAVLAVAVPSGLSLARSGTDAVEIRPARPSPTAGPSAGPTSAPAARTTSGPAAVPTGSAGQGSGSGLGRGREVGGVGITWIPPGMTYFDSGRVGGGTLMPGAVAYRSSFSVTSDQEVSFIAVTVTWGQTPTPDALESRLRGMQQPWRTTARTTVRGRPAVLTRLDQKGEHGLVWAERDGLLLDVTADTSVPEDELRRVAEGLRVGTRPTLDPRVAEAARGAVTRVFTAGTPADEVLAAIENGSDLAGGRQRFLASHPGLARTLRVTVQDMALLDPESVTVVFTLTFTDPTVSAPVAGSPNGPRSYSATGTVVHTADGWKVSRDTYCRLALDVCPVETRAAPTGAPAAAGRPS